MDKDYIVSKGGEGEITEKKKNPGLLLMFCLWKVKRSTFTNRKH